MTQFLVEEALAVRLAATRSVEDGEEPGNVRFDPPSQPEDPGLAAARAFAAGRDA